MSHPELLLQCLQRRFYDVVPKKYRTFCGLTAQIAQAALLRHGLSSRLVPCQLWCATPNRTYVLGWSGTEADHPVWEGHVVCVGESWLLDTAVHHVERDTGLQVPDVVLAPSIPIESHVLARADLSATERLWWVDPPASAQLAIPPEPESVIHDLGLALAQRVALDLLAAA